MILLHADVPEQPEDLSGFRLLLSRLCIARPGDLRIASSIQKGHVSLVTIMLTSTILEDLDLLNPRWS